MAEDRLETRTGESLEPLAATQAAVEAARAALEQARGQRDELLVLASHDFKNAVGIVESALVMIEDSPGLAPSMYGMIRRSTHRLGILANALVDVDVLERGQRALAPVATRWKALVTPVVEAAVPVAATKDVGVRPFGDLDAALTCDTALVERILAALVDHAVGNAPGGTVVDVEGGRTEDGRFRITVAHRGRAVPARALAQYFVTLPLRFCRLAATRHGGTLAAVSPWEEAAGGFGFELVLGG